MNLTIKKVFKKSESNKSDFIKQNKNKENPKKYKDDDAPLMRDLLIHLNDKYKGDWNKIYSALNSRHFDSIDEVKRNAQRLKKEKDYITVVDDEYPAEKYRDIVRPPLVIEKRKINKGRR